MKSRQNSFSGVINLNNRNLTNRTVVRLIEHRLKNYSNKVLEVDFSNNQIGNEGARAIANWLKNCPNLNKINFSNNRIADEGAVAIGEAIKSCPNLQSLIINKNKIRSSGATSISEGIEGSKVLQILSFEENLIGIKGAKSIGKAIMTCPNLRLLSFKENLIGKQGAAAIGEAIKNCPNLMVLSLANNSLGSEGIKHIAEGVSACFKLTKLELSKNSIGNEGAKFIGEAIKNCPELNLLFLDENKIRDEGAIALAEGIETCPKLTSFYLDRNMIESEGARAIAEALKNCFELVKLSFSNNPIGSEGAIALAEGIENCRNLAKVNFAGNRIGIEGAVAIGEKIGNCPNLNVLFLDRNRMGDEGVMAIMEGVKNCSNLVKMGFSYNLIGDLGAVSIGKMSRNLTNLRFLYLHKNQIGDKGIFSIMEGLKNSLKINILSFSENEIGDLGAIVIDKRLHYYRNLQSLDLNKNQIGSVGINILSKYRCSYKYLNNQSNNLNQNLDTEFKLSLINMICNKNFIKIKQLLDGQSDAHSAMDLKEKIYEYINCIEAPEVVEFIEREVIISMVTNYNLEEIENILNTELDKSLNKKQSYILEKYARDSGIGKIIELLDHYKFQNKNDATIKLNKLLHTVNINLSSLLEQKSELTGFMVFNQEIFEILNDLYEKRILSQELEEKLNLLFENYKSISDSTIKLLRLFTTEEESYNNLRQKLKETQNDLKTEIELEIDQKTPNILTKETGIELYESHMSSDHYKKLLSSYPSSEKYNILKSKTCIALAYLAAEDVDVNGALKYCKLSIKFYSYFIESYNKLGAAYSYIGQYENAIKCYGVTKNSLKIGECYIKLFGQLDNPENVAKAMIEYGDYLYSVGLFQSAKNKYEQAISISADEELQNCAGEKKIFVDDHQDEIHEELLYRNEIGYHYNFPEDPDDFLAQLSGAHIEQVLE